MTSVLRILVVVALSLPGAAAAQFGGCASSSIAREYFDPATDRFYLALLNLRGCRGIGDDVPASTVPTGVTWESDLSASRARPLCVFIAQGQADPPSRFFTLNPAECEALKQPGTGWIFVPTLSDGVTPPPGLSAYPVDPATGACPILSAVPSVPVHRFWNNRYDVGLGNHRYVVDGATRSAMRARPGWVEEGIAFCVRFSLNDLIVPEVELAGVRHTYPIGGGIRCDSSDAGSRSCFAAANMPYPAVLREIDTPEKEAAYGARTGINVTGIALTEGITEEFNAPTRSFFQSPLGMFVTSADRVGGAPNALRRVTPLLLPYRPFAVRLDVELDLAVDYTLLVKRARSSGAPNSGAYAQPIVTFTDTASGLALEVSPGAIGTVAMSDILVRDSATGHVLVSLPLRQGMPFGRSLGLSSFRLPNTFDSNAPRGSGGDFAFRINGTEFARLLEWARTLEPRLSAEPMDYELTSVGLKGEAAGDADIGFNVDHLRVAVVRP